MEEELTLHQEEGEIVQSPANNEEAADLIVCPYRRCDKLFIKFAALEDLS